MAAEGGLVAALACTKCVPSGRTLAGKPGALPCPRPAQAHGIAAPAHSAFPTHLQANGIQEAAREGDRRMLCPVEASQS